MNNQVEKMKKELQEELDKFSVLRAQIKKLIESRNKLDVQLNENRLVKEASIFAFVLRIRYINLLILGT